MLCIAMGNHTHFELTCSEITISQGYSSTLTVPIPTRWSHKAKRLDYVTAERNLELKIRKQYPGLTLGGYGRDEGTNRILGGIIIPIPLLNANRKGIAEARAQRDAARADAQATYEEVITSLARAEAMLRSSKIRRDVLERDVAPLADQQLQAARKLGQLGNVNTVVVFEALIRAHETRVELLEAAGREASAQIQINALLRPALGVEPQIKEKQ